MSTCGPGAKSENWPTAAPSILRLARALERALAGAPDLGGLGLDEQRGHLRVLDAHCLLDARNALLDLRRGQPVLELGAQRGDYLVRAHLHGEHAVDVAHARIVRGD